MFVPDATEHTAMSKPVQFNLGNFNADVHRIARIRAAEQRMTLKDYIKYLILDDVKRAEEARAAQQVRSDDR